MATKPTPVYTFTYVPTGTATTNAAVAITGSSRKPFLHAITINTKGASSNTMTVSDAGVSTIAVIDSTSTIGTLYYDVVCPNGIRVVSATGTGADYTIIWKWIDTADINN